MTADQPTPAETPDAADLYLACPNYPATCRGCVECRATEYDHDGWCFCDCPGLAPSGEEGGR